MHGVWFRWFRHGKVLALKYGNEVIGGAQFMRDWSDPAKAYLVGIAVDSSFRGKGLGTRFYQLVLSCSKPRASNALNGGSAKLWRGQSLRRKAFVPDCRAEKTSTA